MGDENVHARGGKRDTRSLVKSQNIFRATHRSFMISVTRGLATEGTRAIRPCDGIWRLCRLMLYTYVNRTGCCAVCKTNIRREPPAALFFTEFPEWNNYRSERVATKNTRILSILVIIPRYERRERARRCGTARRKRDSGVATSRLHSFGQEIVIPAFISGRRSRDVRSHRETIVAWKRKEKKKKEGKKKRERKKNPRNSRRALKKQPEHLLSSFHPPIFSLSLSPFLSSVFRLAPLCTTRSPFIDPVSTNISFICKTHDLYRSTRAPFFFSSPLLSIHKQGEEERKREREADRTRAREREKERIKLARTAWLVQVGKVRESLLKDRFFLQHFFFLFFFLILRNIHSKKVTSMSTRRVYLIGEIKKKKIPDYLLVPLTLRHVERWQHSTYDHIARTCFQKLLAFRIQTVRNSF
ncbi:hypothetical protein PUN28_018055 [Cardiocondyla obscurior]|uniref:Transmembrane protein n=1 Tax=Cardiocondyla obscurior TaxID=286306 RepID=A0AAW2EGL0_9HYME